jgi:hypothetical protein
VRCAIVNIAHAAVLWRVLRVSERAACQECRGAVDWSENKRAMEMSWVDVRAIILGGKKYLGRLS